MDSKSITLSFTPPKCRLTIPELIQSLNTLIKLGRVTVSEIQEYIQAKHLLLDSSSAPLSDVWVTSLKQKVYHSTTKDLRFYLLYDYKHLNRLTIGQKMAFYLFYLIAKEVHLEFIVFLEEIKEKVILEKLQEQLLEITE